MTIDNKRGNYAVRQGETGIDILKIVLLMLKKWYYILILMVVVSGMTYAYMLYTYKPIYVSDGQFRVTIKPSGNSSTDETNQEPKYSIADALGNAQTYIHILTDSKLAREIKKELGVLANDMKEEQIRRCIKVEQVPQTPFMRVTVTSNDKNLTYGIAQQVFALGPDMVRNTLNDEGWLTIYDAPCQAYETSTPGGGKTTSAIVGIVVSLALGFLWAFIFDMLSDNVKTIKDVQNKIGTPLLGVIPENISNSKRKSKNKNKTILINSANAHFSFVEAYKSLRTKLESLSIKKGYKKIIVTSSYQHEGKTTVSINLAVALAQNGRSVIVIDCDLRKPRISKIFESRDESKDVGMIQILEGEAMWKDCVKYVNNCGVFIITSGGTTEMASELLSSNKIDEMLDGLEREFDFIIFDTPPVNMVTDAAVLSAYADASVMIIKQELSPVDNINQSIDDMSTGNAKVIGCVFNMANTTNVLNRYGRYGYRSKYGGRYGGEYR